MGTQIHVIRRTERQTDRQTDSQADGQEDGQRGLFKGHLISLLYFALPILFHCTCFVRNILFMSSSSGEIKNTNSHLSTALKGRRSVAVNREF